MKKKPTVEAANAAKACTHARVAESIESAWVNRGFISVKCCDCDRRGWIPISVEWDYAPIPTPRRRKSK